MSAINVSYINPFLAAAKNVCGISLNLPIVTGKPSLAVEGDRLWKVYGISAVVQLTDAVKGVVLVSFSEAAAIALASRFTGETLVSLNADCRDALGELANQIIGSAKVHLPTGLISISTPKIVETREVALPPGRPILVLPFDTSVGRFVVQVAIESIQEKPAESTAA
jgi:CheY-specific phosphatase CheX